MEEIAPFILPKVDTQKPFDRIIYFDGYKKLKLESSMGVYAVFHKFIGRTDCLYVGATARLKSRALRFFRKTGRFENFYMKAVLNAIKKENIWVKVKYLNCRTSSELSHYEDIYIDYFRPFFNFGRTYQFNISTARCFKLFHEDPKAYIKECELYGNRLL